MPSVTFTPRAVALIEKRLAEPANVWMRKDDSIPLLAWASRVSSVDQSGERREYGPMFSLYWTDLQTIEDDGCLLLYLPNGEEIALANGFFRDGSHLIDVKDGRLMLFSTP